MREQARIAQLAVEIEQERRRLAQRSQYSFALPADHVVWSLAVSPGASVVEGQTLLDLASCGQRFVVVELPERQFEAIRRGDPAEVRLLGSDAWVEGTVQQIRGSAARQDDRLLAAQLLKPGERQISVEVRLPASAGPADASTLCDIGRQAEVRFAGAAPALLAWLQRVIGGIGGSRALAADEPAQRYDVVAR
jgi:hypothetical protein